MKGAAQRKGVGECNLGSRESGASGDFHFRYDGFVMFGGFDLVIIGKVVHDGLSPEFFPMALNRRSFIGLGSLLACGTALSPASLLAAPAPRILRGGLPLRAGDETVLALVKRYASQVRIVGASVLARIRTAGLRKLHVLAEVQDLSALQAVLPTAGVGEIYVKDNTLSFTVGDVDAVVENLLPAVFAARLVAMGKPAGNAFAHDALSYDPASKLLSDPFAARSTGIRVINKTFGGAAALEVVLRGISESVELGVPASADFVAWKARILQQIAKPADSEALAEKFLQNLALLADKLPAAAFLALLRTRLVSTALKLVFGIEVAVVISQFKELRGSNGGDVPNSALWLAVLLAPEIQSNGADGAATTWLQGGNRFEVLRSRKALALAVQLN